MRVVGIFHAAQYTFDVYAFLCCQAIKRTIDKKTVDVFQMFNDELNAVKKELTQKTTPLPSSHPKFAGQAHWARFLKKRVERSMMVINALYKHCFMK